MSNFWSFLSKKQDGNTDDSKPDFESLKNSDLPLWCKEKDNTIIEFLAFDMEDGSDRWTFMWDPLLEKSAWLIFENQQVSARQLSENLLIGHLRAVNILHRLEEFGIVSPGGFETRSLIINRRSKLESILKQINLDRQFITQFYNTHREEVDKRIAEMRGSQEREAGDYRGPIPQEVKDAVWNRDGGKCVNCGCQENLEFDHIIPIAKGGANTYRNVQLLCERCNRQKGAKIG